MKEEGNFYKIIVDKDFKNNTLIVAKSEHASELYKKEMVIEKVSWIFEKPKFPLKCKVKIRYLHPAMPAVINKNRIIFDKKIRAITSGQSAVFYKGNEVLGGGIIC